MIITESRSMGQRVIASVVCGLTVCPVITAALMKVVVYGAFGVTSWSLVFVGIALLLVLTAVAGRRLCGLRAGPATAVAFATTATVVGLISLWVSHLPDNWEN